MKTILKLTNIDKFIGKKQILFWVNLEVKAWEIYWFLWPNWAGKTTTMKTIMWFIKEDSWSVEVLWEKWLNLEARKQIWFMPENTYLYKYLTWREFLKFNAWFFDIKKEDLDKKIDELLQKVWLKEAWDKFLHSYSKWMLQRIWLAQSIINNPKLLFLDEPMSWLDPIWRKMVKDLLVELKKSGTTIFFNTHVLADVESICDRVSIIHKWKIIVDWKNVKEIDSGLENFFIEKVWEADSNYEIR